MRSCWPVAAILALFFQSGALFDSMSVYDNVAFPLQTPASQTRKKKRESDTTLEELKWPRGAQIWVKYRVV